MGHRFGVAYPFLYALLPNKKGPTYQALLGGIKTLDTANSLAPDKFNCDFGMANIKNVQRAFPSVSIVMTKHKSAASLFSLEDKVSRPSHGIFWVQDVARIFNKGEGARVIQEKVGTRSLGQGG